MKPAPENEPARASVGRADLQSTSWVMTVMWIIKTRRKEAIIKYSEVQHHNYSGLRSKQMTHSKKAADQMDSALIIIM